MGRKKERNCTNEVILHVKRNTACYEKNIYKKNTKNSTRKHYITDFETVPLWNDSQIDVIDTVSYIQSNNTQLDFGIKKSIRPYDRTAHIVLPHFCCLLRKKQYFIIQKYFNTPNQIS